MYTLNNAKITRPDTSCQEDRLLLYFHALNRARVQAVDDEGRELLKGEARRIREMIP